MANWKVIQRNAMVTIFGINAILWFFLGENFLGKKTIFVW